MQYLGNQRIASVRQMHAVGNTSCPLKKAIAEIFKTGHFLRECATANFSPVRVLGRIGKICYFNYAIAKSEKIASIMNDCICTDERELLYRLQNGDDAAFTALYNRYWKSMFYTAAQKLQSLPEAEEVVQDIFMELWRRRSELEIKTSFSAYLAGCVKYKIITALAKRNRQVHLGNHADFASDLPDHATEQALRLGELQEQLHREVEKLPEKCRLVFRLSREVGFSQKQIATELGIAEKTVEAHLSRAMRSLRTGLGQLLGSIYMLLQTFY